MTVHHCRGCQNSDPFLGTLYKLDSLRHVLGFWGARVGFRVCVSGAGLECFWCRGFVFKDGWRMLWEIVDKGRLNAPISRISQYDTA